MVIDFQKLWNSHPLNWNPPVNHPCLKPDGSDAFPHECSIKMSIALMGAGVNMDACPKRKCWYKGHKNHVLAAQELADWLSLKPVLGTPKKFTQPKKQTKEEYAKSALANVVNKSGIVFFQNFWTPEGSSSPSGDHIDVWNGSFMSGIALGMNYSGDKIGYFTRAPHIWFWELK